MKIKVFWVLETCFAWLGQVFSNLSRRCALCPTCGANRDTGKPCVIMTPVNDCGHLYADQ
jgi:hypothetical protein